MKEVNDHQLIITLVILVTNTLHLIVFTIQQKRRNYNQPSQFIFIFFFSSFCPPFFQPKSFLSPLSFPSSSFSLNYIILLFFIHINTSTLPSFTHFPFQSSLLNDSNFQLIQSILISSLFLLVFFSLSLSPLFPVSSLSSPFEKVEDISSFPYRISHDPD